MQAIHATPRFGEAILGSRVLRTLVVVYLLVLLISLAGIATRPMDFFATFWPANAVLLGFFIRKPAYATSAGWIAAFLGYITADFLTGGAFRFTIVLALANLAGVAPAYAIFHRLPAHIRETKQPMSVLAILFVSACGAASATIAAALLAGDMLDGSAFENAMFWFCSELANFIVILPLILSIPSGIDVKALLRKKIDRDSVTILDVAPALTLLVSLIIGLVVGGPGSIAFPLPALMWCALRYPVFPTALMILLVGIWELLAISTGLVGVQGQQQVVQMDAIISVRLGISLMALAPLAVSIINTSRVDLIARLDSAAYHDMLTGLPNRRAFTTWGQEHIEAAGEDSRGIAVLMIDLDHFKEINDRFGHDAGDQVLVHFADTARSSLRSADLLCRWGGEEFVVLLLNATRDSAESTARRLLLNAEASRAPGPDGHDIWITVSIGAAWFPTSHNACIATLLRTADNALYRAKAAGRNQFILTDAEAMPVHPE